MNQLEKTFSTSFMGEYLLPDLILPEKMHGLQIVDVGAGGSNITALLRARGAQAFAVDPRYISPDFTELRESIHSKLGVEAQPQPISRIQQAVRNWYLRNWAGHHGKNQYALEQMLLDAEKNGAFYLNATADNIPLDTNSADNVFSLEAVSAFLMDDYSELRKAINEMVRIAKKDGGIVQVLPWPSEIDQGRWSESQLHNAERIQREISKRVLACTIEPCRYADQLVIQK